jgi:uncharacterized protein (DUF486 family)
MKTFNKQNWLRNALLFGLLYFVVGILFALLANSSASIIIRNIWRWAAFLVSGIIFLLNIIYEHYRLHNPSLSTAIHVSLGIALGAFGLAAAANLQDLWSGSENHSSIALALILWPILTAIPAFLVSFAIAAIMKRLKTNS